MAAHASNAGTNPFLNARIVEWSLMAVLIASLTLVFLQRVRAVQRQAELASVRSTLGGLRTAFVLQHLHQAAGQGQASMVLQHNPFELLQRRPPNYFGETRGGASAVPPGNWVFDALCVCVGYLPSDSSEFSSPSGDALAWYRVEQSSAGPLQLTAKERYVWQGQLVD